MFAYKILPAPRPREGTHEEAELLIGQQILEQVPDQDLQRFMDLLVASTYGGQNAPTRYAAQTSLRVFKTLIGQGNTIILTVRGEIAATASMEPWGRTTDGRDVISIGKVVTLPKFEGRRLAKRAMGEAADLIYRRDATAALRVRTKEPAIKNICSFTLWRVIGAAEDYALWERGRREGLPSPDWFPRTGQGWITFLSGPT